MVPPIRPFQERASSASSFHASLFQAVDGVMSLALCQQVVFQAHLIRWLIRDGGGGGGGGGGGRDERVKARPRIPP